MNNDDQLKMWRALSDLFLDTEIEDYIYKYVARTVSECGLSLAEAEEILWYEVYPVLEGNLRIITGVWEGWSDSWLLQNLPAPVRPNSIHGDPSIIKEIKRCWQCVTEAYESQNV
ncbi:hypothetical protein CPU12_02590 [Malaciobacter molluscorum LMG 25693]|uniref:DUF7079 domain-containing protein n=1 Tax=Malaciobacter molluscorum LMG 25693 TaxID=870501 RepID=A0A2G1DKZ1_9BACT|nr:hypothetical protein [Malaciobacter molluscorum]AXX92735.1 hypothetical protein AMOL_1771 [Malaciobacter molluscorum LMG 25693]PHO19149.1 hypothetical protein CPU12_02590 [Malaciobacter molluscorum LMG 25693]